MRVITLPGVFQPRSDTWMLVDAVRRATLPPRATALDLCTGGGAVAVAQRGVRSVTAVDTHRRSTWAARPTDRDTAARWADESETTGADSPMTNAGVAMVRSHVALMDGDFAESRRQMQIADEAFGAIGYELLRSATGQFYAQIELAAGNPGEAARLARTYYEIGGSLGDTSYRPTTGAHLAAALVADGQLVDAMSADADVINFVMTRGARARVAEARGDRERAKELAREGVDFALRTDFVLWHGYAYEVLFAVDPNDVEARERMLEAFQIKGYQPGLQAYS